MKRLAMHAMLLAIGAGSAIAQVAEQSSTISPAATRTTITGSSSPIVVKIDSATATDIAGQPIGRIENVVLSPVGCAEAAIVVGSNGRLIPVPWTMVRTIPAATVGTTLGSNLRFTINLDQQRILQAPSFARTELPTMMNNEQWLQQSFTFFGVQSSSPAAGATGSSAAGVTGAAGSTAVGTDQSRFGTTATTVPNSSTATRVPTNSSSTILPPTGRPNPTQPGSTQPGSPSQPTTPDNSQTSPSSPSQPASPSRPATPPSSSPSRP